MRAPFSGAPKASLTSKALTACAAATLALGLGVGTASALPPGGEGIDSRHFLDRFFVCERARRDFL